MAFDWPWRGLLLLLALAPLPLGANRPIAWSILGLSASILLIGWGKAVLDGRAALVWHRALLPPALGVALSIVWIGVQALPLGVAENSFWSLAATELATPLPASISVAPDAAGPGLVRLMTYISIFWLSMQYCRNPVRAMQLVTWLSIVSAAYAAYGIVVYMSGNESLLWFDRWAYKRDLTSSFVNRNSYATFAGLGVLIASTAAAVSFKNVWGLSDRSLPPRARVVECLLGWPLVHLMLAIVVATAWLQTHSRMGFAATVVAGGMALLLTRLSGAARLSLLGAVSISGAGLLLFLLSGDITLDRIARTDSFDRAPLFDTVVEAIGQEPWVGHGYGSFRSVLPAFRDLSLRVPNDYTEAHNTYLELALELGIPGATVLVASVLWLTGLCLVATFKRHRMKQIAILAVASSVLVGVHALTDFSVQVPAVACLFASVLGLGVAQSWSSRRSTHRFVAE